MIANMATLERHREVQYTKNNSKYMFLQVLGSCLADLSIGCFDHVFCGAVWSKYDKHCASVFCGQRHR